MSKEEMSEALKRAIAEGEVEIDEADKTALVRLDWVDALIRTTPDFFGPLLITLRRQLGIAAELGKLGYTVTF